MSEEITYRGEKHTIDELGCVTINSEQYKVCQSMKEYQNCINNFELQSEWKYLFINFEWIEEVPVVTECIFLQKAKLTKCQIIDCKFDAEVCFIDCVFSSDILRKENKIELFENAEFTRDVSCQTVLDHGLETGPTKMEDTFISTCFYIYKKITFVNASIGNFEVNLPQNKEQILQTEIEFKKCKFNEKFKIRNREFEFPNTDEYTNYEYQQQNKAKLNKLEIINCTAEDNAYLRFGFLDVKEFVVQNLRLPNGAELNIGDCRFENFRLSNFRNIGKLKLFKINVWDDEKEENNNFQIDNTSIGDADFQSIDLSSFTTVTLFDNLYHNLTYTNVQWKKDLEVGQDLENNNFKLIKQQDTYRSLKNVALENNDTPQAIEFYAKEMMHYEQLVRNNPSEYSSSDKVTLWFNKVTNNFGLNWVSPLLLLLILSYVFFLLILLSTKETYFQIITLADHKYWVQLLNPLHSLEFTGSGSWRGRTYLWDFLFRIIQGLLLYQIISAFRKFSKKF